MRSQNNPLCLGLALAVALSGTVLAQKTTRMKMGGGGSPHDRSEWTIDGAQIAVEYGRPSVKGRKIFGALLPYGSVWRAGADEATTLTTDAALTIGNLTVPPGKYTLFAWPDEKQWKLIVNKQTGQWGTQYDASQDLGRVDMKTEKTAAPVEQFTISVDDTPAGGTLTLEWENTRASVPFTVKR